MSLESAADTADSNIGPVAESPRKRHEAHFILPSVEQQVEAHNTSNIPGQAAAAGSTGSSRPIRDVDFILRGCVLPTPEDYPSTPKSWFIGERSWYDFWLKVGKHYDLAMTFSERQVHQNNRVTTCLVELNGDDNFHYSVYGEGLSKVSSI